jgi:hypothetical protein
VKLNPALSAETSLPVVSDRENRGTHLLEWREKTAELHVAAKTWVLRSPGGRLHTVRDFIRENEERGAPADVIWKAPIRCGPGRSSGCGGGWMDRRLASLNRSRAAP